MRESTLTSAPKTVTNTSVPTITTDDVIIVSHPLPCCENRGSVPDEHDVSLSRDCFTLVTIVPILCEERGCDGHEVRNAAGLAVLPWHYLVIDLPYDSAFADIRAGREVRMWLTPSALEIDHSNSSHPLNRLPKTSVRLVVETTMRPLSLSTPTTRSCTSKGFDANPPMSGVNPINRSLVMKTAP